LLKTLTTVREGDEGAKARKNDPKHERRRTVEMSTLLNSRFRLVVAAMGLALALGGVTFVVAQNAVRTTPGSADARPPIPPETVAAMKRVLASKAPPQAADRRVIEDAVNTLRAARKADTEQLKSPPRTEITAALEESLRRRQRTSLPNSNTRAAVTSTPKPTTDETLLKVIPRPATAKPRGAVPAATGESTIRGGRTPLGTQQSGIEPTGRVARPDGSR
jgi:hypothetical protein